MRRLHSVSRRRILLAVLALGALGARGTSAQSLLFEDFESAGQTQSGQHGPSGLIAAGWQFRNQSEPLSSGDWDRWAYSYQGSWALHVNTSVSFWSNEQSEASSWAILPAVPGQVAGDELRFFYSCLIAPPLVAGGQLELRYSPTGGTGTGSSPNDVGDFTTLMAVVPYIDNVYQELRQTLPGPGRIALRFHIPPQPSQPTFWAGFQLDNLSVGPPVVGPPVPQPGETVTWSAATRSWSCPARPGRTSTSRRRSRSSSRRTRRWSGSRSTCRG